MMSKMQPLLPMKNAYKSRRFMKQLIPIRDNFVKKMLIDNQQNNVPIAANQPAAADQEINPLIADTVSTSTQTVETYSISDCEPQSPHPNGHINEMIEQVHHLLPNENSQYSFASLFGTAEANNQPAGKELNHEDVFTQDFGAKRDKSASGAHDLSFSNLFSLSSTSPKKLNAPTNNQQPINSINNNGQQQHFSNYLTASGMMLGSDQVHNQITRDDYNDIFVEHNGMLNLSLLTDDNNGAVD